MYLSPLWFLAAIILLAVAGCYGIKKITPHRFLYTTSGKLRLSTVVISSFFAAFLGCIPGMGFPGGMMIVIGGTILEYTVGFFGFPRFSDWPSYAIWPAAILMTLTLFPLLIVAYAIAFRCYKELSRWRQWMIWIAVCLLWSIVGSALITMMIDFPGLQGS